jgi:hypothetical protein
MLALGVLLALYDSAEVLLKPDFGAWDDQIGPRLVLLGGRLRRGLGRVRARRRSCCARGGPAGQADWHRRWRFGPPPHDKTDCTGRDATNSAA